MKIKISLPVAIAILLLGCIITFQITYVVEGRKYKSAIDAIEISDQNETYEKLSELDEVFRKYYVGEIDEDTLVNSLMEGYVKGTGDKYAEYISAENIDEYIDDLNGDYEGIGVIVQYNSEYMALEVVSVFKDSPALEAGLKSGDLILAINGVDVANLGYYSAISLLKGEVESTVSITVADGENYSERKIIDVQRAKLEAQTVFSHVYDNNGQKIAVVKIIEFNSHTYDEFVSAVSDLCNQKINDFIFDVRDNPGGLLTSVTSILDYIIPEGVILRITDSEGNESTITSDANYLCINMAVLVNENTASAGEIFASVLGDYNYATLIGEKTYGKGCMQTIIRLADNSAVKLTYRKFSPPFSMSFDEIGIVPDIQIELSDEAKEYSAYNRPDEIDNQLMRAVESLDTTAKAEESETENEN